ncbi:GAF domain-containing SpoIIE family protein phosphatase [Catenulispora yoronensis]
MGLLSTELRWAYVNAAFLSTTGLDPARVLSRPVAATPFAADLAVIRRVLADGNPQEAVDGAEAASVTATATGWQVRYRRLEVDGRAAGVVVAVTGTATRHQRQLDQARRRLALQRAAAARIGTTLDVDITCIELAELTVPAMADLAIVEVMPYEVANRGHGSGGGFGTGSAHGTDSAHGTGTGTGSAHSSSPAPASGADPRRETPRMRRAALACAPDLRRWLGPLALTGISTRPAAGSAVARSLAEGRLVVANLLSDEELAERAHNADTLAAYRAAGIGSILAVPLRARGQVVGVLTLARGRGASEGFTDDDAVLIQDLADRAAVSVENARQYADSQSVTLELQRALLIEPGRPHSNLEVAARYLPSGNRALVGGDWYEIIRLPFGRTLLVMGDVMGHGVEAAVDMSIYRSAIRDVGSMDLPPHGILRHLDTLIAQDESARPATCLLAVADPNRGRWTFASAGHLPPALFAPDRPTELVAIPTGPPLGTGLGGYERVIVDLDPDQVLLIYTDGLVERRGEDIDVSLARLASLPLPGTGALEDLLDDALRRVAPAAIEDDIAILAARATPR